MNIFIDPGHNFSGADTGASGNGLREQDVTFIIGDKLYKLLEEAGHEVSISREYIYHNVGSSLAESINIRAQKANSVKADLFVSIHCNAHDTRAKGTETLVYSTKSEAYPIAKRVQKAIVERLGTFDRGVKVRTDLGVLEDTKMPALLVETAFIDNEKDAELLLNRTDDFAKAIFEGITGEKVKEENKVGQTVMELKGSIFVQEIDPKDFKIIEVDKRKKDTDEKNAFNCGFFTTLKDGTTIPVGNLASNGVILSNAKDNESWINLSGHKLTTIYTTKDGGFGFTKTDDLNTVSNLKTAVSGIPIILGGKQVTMDEIKAEGYFGNELYDTWHGFLGIRNGRFVYVGAECAYSQMCWMLVALGIYDCIKVDGGDSYILINDGDILKSEERREKNRRIHNIGVWM